MEEDNFLTEKMRMHQIKAKYDKIVEDNIAGYCFVSLALKNFTEYCHTVGHEKRDEIIALCHQLLQDILWEDEYIVLYHSCIFNILLHCPADEEALHKRVRVLHFLIRDEMEKQYGVKLFLEIGFYPIIKKDVDFYQAQYLADKTRFGSDQQPYVETNYDMYYVSFLDQNEVFRALEKNLEKALSSGEFKLYLQPKVNIKTGRVHSAEALMRWDSPDKGLIPLGDFLPNIEANGFIRDIDLYLFDQGCQYIEKWKKQFEKDIQISFNLSAAYYNGPYFIPEYRDVIEKYDISGDHICIELLESVVLNKLDKLNEVVNGIYDLGFQCALDDFGSGFSSFDILTNVTLSELKIDRSLFRNSNNAKERVLIKYLLDIAHKFDIRVTAEGIETQAYADYLSSIGCDYIQGYYYYKPMPIEEFEQRFIFEKQS